MRKTQKENQQENKHMQQSMHACIQEAHVPGSYQALTLPICRSSRITRACLRVPVALRFTVLQTTFGVFDKFSIEMFEKCFFAYKKM